LILRQLVRFFVVGALALSAGAGAQPAASTSDQRFRAFIELNQFTSPYNGGVPAERWCLYTKIDRSPSAWYFTDPASDYLDAVQVWNGFGVPFVASHYGNAGAILVGYSVGGQPTNGQLAPVSFSANPTECDLGIRILTNGPYPIASLAMNLDSQTAIDAAPEYQVWFAKGTYHRVRLISLIPVTYQVGASQIPGKIVVAFTGNW